MNILSCGTPSGRATYSGFIPYRGDDVKEDYLRVDLPFPGLTDVWVKLDAQIVKTGKVKYKVIDPIVQIIGHGEPPYIPWKLLPLDLKKDLVQYKLETEPH